jgi:hypothetical protein
MHKILQSYLLKLTDLSSSNRTLLLPKLPAQQFIDLHRFDFLTDKPSFSILQALIAKKKATLCAMADSRDEAVNKISLALKRLARHDKFLWEERGAKDLFVGWPFVRGKFSDGTPVRCPVLFFPVELVEESSRWVLAPRGDGEPMLNQSFLLAYAHFNQIKLDGALLERPLDDFDHDSMVFRTALYHLFKESNIEVHFNQENFSDHLQMFVEMSRADLEVTEQEGELKFYPEAVLGIFPQAGSFLVPDYQFLLENPLANDLEEFFLKRSPGHSGSGSSPDFAYLREVKEERTFTPFALDAYQENAIKAVKSGQSVVVQGPPGTGKSQLICNMVADFIARGKKVLVVCQKRAALDVVYERLQDLGLGDFLGLTHDVKSDRKILFEKIARQIDRIDEYKLRNAGLDFIQMERRFVQISRRIDQITEELEEFKTALYDDSECGLSPKELYLTSHLQQQVIGLRQEYRYLHFGQLDDFLRKLRLFLEFRQRFGHSDYPLTDRLPFSHMTLSDLKTMQELLVEIPAYQQALTQEIAEVIPAQLSLEECEFFLSRREAIIEMLRLLANPTVYTYFCHMVPTPDKLTDNLWLANTERVVMECYKGEGPETSLPTDQLGKFQEALKRRMDAGRSLIKYIRWRFFSKDKYFIKRVLVANHLHPTRNDFKRLVERVDNRLNLEHNLTKIKRKDWLMEIPQGYQKAPFQNWFHVQRQAVKAKLIFSSMRNFKEFFPVQKLPFEEFRAKLDGLYRVVREVPERRERWRIYLSTSQMARLLNHPQAAELMAETLRRDFDALCEFDSLRESLAPHEEAVVYRLIDEVPSDDPETLEHIFQNSLRLGWLEHIETKYPILRAVSSMKLQQLESELRQCVQEKAELSAEIVRMKVREQTYEEVSYNRLHNRVTYRDLYHQTTKKRRIWPLRKVIHAYGEELLQVVPCWLASPESVSAMFPMEEIFDLVVFDEASQCFAEKGIPAMYRGRQVVVTGDHQQLRPNDLYSIRWEEEENDLPDLELESLLELSSRYLQGVQLRGHYRSQSPDLIEFSNHHFYQGKLRLLPDFHILNRNEPGLNYIKVEGTWENHTNRAEAEEVVQLVYSLRQQHPHKSIGVVTFNARQQGLIQDLMEQAAIERKEALPERFFVKNIENVQGDEKDFIIFSTGYGPDKRGRLIMQFGSLNAQYGENRLNVAITRAREKVYVVSSLYPQQMKVEESKNSGPKLLKAYLSFAQEVSEGRFQYLPTIAEKHKPYWYLKSTLPALLASQIPNLQLKEDLPFADLSIYDGEKYLGLVLTDDDIYYQSVSVKDMHVYRPNILTAKNWGYVTFFSRDFWNDPQRVQEKLAGFVTRAQDQREDSTPWESSK